MDLPSNTGRYVYISGHTADVKFRQRVLRFMLSLKQWLLTTLSLQQGNHNHFVMLEEISFFKIKDVRFLIFIVFFSFQEARFQGN